jgi:hypothetical protein
MYLNWPTVLVMDPQPIDPRNPHAWQFSLQVKGSLWASDLEASCLVKEITYDTGYQFLNAKYDDPPVTEFGHIDEGAGFQLTCPQLFWIARNGKKLTSSATNNLDPESVKIPAGYSQLRVNSAMLDIDVSYRRLSLIPARDRLRWVARASPNGDLRWARTGPNEHVLLNPAAVMRHVLQRCRSFKTSGAYTYQVTLVTNPSEPLPSCEGQGRN